MKPILNTLIILALFVLPCPAQNDEINKNVFFPGETLIYKVKWTFLRIGTITIKTYSSEEGSDYVKVSMTVKSSPSLFFIDIEEYNETLIEIASSMSKSYYGNFRDGNDRTIIRSEYSSPDNCAYYSEYDDVKKSTVREDTIHNSPRYVDGPSLFFFTRTYSRNQKSYDIPNMVNGKIENTKISFTGKTEMIEVDAFAYPVKARKFNGFADWEGGTSQGLSGEFSGWIGDNEAALLLYAEVSVLLGKLKIELEYQNRIKSDNNFRTAR